MKKTIILTIMAAAALSISAQVQPGIEVLRENNFDILRGKRVGLITNPTGVDNNLKPTVDILSEAPEVELVALYAPEHGVRGDFHAGDKVENAVDSATGIPVYSIYGKHRKPSPEMLKDIDVLVYDVQDNGCRSFTFISSMGNAMEACAELGKEFVVLDRPNPINGNKIEGNLTEPDCISFVSQFAIPYLYGLTPGELARYLNEEGLLKNGVKADLKVVPMKGYERSMDFRATGMPWVLPSPHMPTPETAVYYPVSGILGELYCISIGVGYTMPFKLFGADWIDAQRLAKRLNDRKLPGLEFRPIYFKPFYSTGQGKNYEGVEVYVTDVDKAPLSLTQFYVMEELAEMYPDKKIFDIASEKRFSMFDKVCGSKEIRRRFTKRYKTADIEDYWNKDNETFRAASQKYHIYK